MRIFGIPALPSPPLVPKVPHLPDEEAQRRLIARARRQARAWLLRGALLVVAAALGVRSGWLLIGVVCFLLALLVLELSHSHRKQAAELERRLAGAGRP